MSVYSHSESFSVPSAGVITQGLPSNVAFEIQQNNTVQIPVTFYLYLGQNTSGNYSIGLNSVNFSYDSGDKGTVSEIKGVGTPAISATGPQNTTTTTSQTTNVAQQLSLSAIFEGNNTSGTVTNGPVYGFVASISNPNVASLTISLSCPAGVGAVMKATGDCNDSGATFAGQSTGSNGWQGLFLNSTGSSQTVIVYARAYDANKNVLATAQTSIVIPSTTSATNTITTVTPTITVTYPSAGNVLDDNAQKGSGPGPSPVANIQWTSSGLGSDMIGIELLGTNGQQVRSIANNISNTGSYLWPSDPTLQNGSYEIEVYDTSAKGLNIQAQSGYFTITNSLAGQTTQTTVTTSPNQSVTGTETIAPNNQTISSGQTATLNVTVPSNTTSAKIYLSCSYGIGATIEELGDLDPCNAYENLPVSVSQIHVTLSNTTSNPITVVPNYYIYTSANPNYAYGVSSSITVLPVQTTTTTPTTSPLQSSVSNNSVPGLTIMASPVVAAAGQSFTITSVATGGSFTQHGLEICLSTNPCTAGNDGGHGWQNIGANNPPSAGTDALTVPYSPSQAGTYSIHAYDSVNGGASYTYTPSVQVTVTAATSMNAGSSNLGSAYVGVNDVINLLNLLK